MFCFLSYKLQNSLRVAVALNIDIKNKSNSLGKFFYPYVHRSEMDLKCLWIVFLFMKIVTGMFVCSFTFLCFSPLSYVRTVVIFDFNDTHYLCLARQHKRLT